MHDITITYIKMTQPSRTDSLHNAEPYTQNNVKVFCGVGCGGVWGGAGVRDEDVYM